MLAVLKVVGALLVVAAVPLAIVSTNIRLMVFDRGLWERAYARHGVSQTTGISIEQLRTANDQIMSYFEGGPMVSLEVQKEWGREPLFNQREQTHLADVRDLVLRALAVQQISLASVIVAAAFLVLRRAPRTLAKLISAGTILTLVIFGGIGLAAVGNFRDLWLQFHLISFTNEFWQLDPRTDYMIRMTPEGFYFDMVLELVGRSTIVAVVLLLLGQIYLWRVQAPSPPAPSLLRGRTG